MPEFLRFGTVGLAATGIHWIVLSLVVETFGILTSLANGLAFLCAASVTYLGQSLWVFSARSHHNAMQVLRFTLSLAIGFVANVCIMALTIHVLGLPYQAGFLLGIIVVPALSFLINRFWVFNHV